jgi:PKD repeat protein
VTFNVGAPAVNYTVRMTNVPADGATTAPIFQVGPTAGTLVAADPASTFLPDGTIRIVVPRSAIGNPAPGQSLTGFLTRIAAGVVTPDNMPDSLAPSGSYTIAGNVPCVAPNAAPTALLTGTPQSGPAPLTVNFTGAGSTDPDSGDTIASYTFNFGDGSPAVTQSSPTISHTYNVAPGQYTAQLTVTDSHGLASTNPALFVINVSAVLRNISTRAQVLTGDNVLIGGFIITGTQPKKVIVRAIGPSLKANGQSFPGAMQDPTLELHDQSTLIATNDNWKTNDQDHQSQQAEIEATGIPPKDDRESALVRTLNPGNYTVVLRGLNNTTGVAVVEAYDLDSAATSQLANISSRGLVQTGDNVMIGGFVVGPETAANTRVVVRGIGPSLSGAQVPTPLQDPTLELHNGNGDKIASNDNWKIDDKTQQSQQAAIQATGLAPTDDRESAILIDLAPGSYTAIIAGKGGGTGTGVVEIYNVP